MNEFEIGDVVSYPLHDGYGVIEDRNDKHYAINWDDDHINMYPNDGHTGLLSVVNTAAWQDFQDKIKDRI